MTESIEKALAQQRFIVHAFLTAEVYDLLRQVWAELRTIFKLHFPIGSDDLAFDPPVEAPSGDPNVLTMRTIAGQQSEDHSAQALLRLHGDLFNLSLIVALPAVTSHVNQWNSWMGAVWRWGRSGEVLLTHFLGEVRLFVATAPGIEVGSGKGASGGGQPSAAAGNLARRLQGNLGQSAHRPVDWWEHGVAVNAGCAIFELPGAPNPRLRELVVVAATEHDDSVSALLWSTGGTAIPLLARYLANAALLHHGIRQREVTLASHVWRTPAGAAAMAEWLRDTRRPAETLQRNLDRAGRAAAGAGIDFGLFRDDRDEAHWYVAQLGDDIAGMDTARQPSTGPRPLRRPQGQRVFVIHGRDRELLSRVFDFLRSAGLEPNEWEMLARQARTTAPDLLDVIKVGIAEATAVIVLLTPDDLARLDPALSWPHDSDSERGWAMQPRPNVYLELGLTLAWQRDRTIVVKAGTTRDISDLTGLFYLWLDGTRASEVALLERLRTAGCDVAPDLAARLPEPGHFAGLSAWDRRPHAMGRDE